MAGTGEILMLSQFAVPAENRRLRFVFDDAVVSLSLAPDATFEDVARRWAELAPHHPGSPVAIDVTMPPPAGSCHAFRDVSL
jgi:hypothetical protein